MSLSAPQPRPRLLAQNRKLRHLKGLSLRNLSVSRPPRPTHALDDASVSIRSLKRPANSPSRALAASFSSLSQRRSTHDLRAATSRADDSWTASGITSTGKAAAGSPDAVSRGRSFTSSSQAVGTRERHAVVQHVVEKRLADGFFSLHCDGEEEPVYVSEVIERSMNFNFGFFDLTRHSPALYRLSLLTIKFWARQRAWILLVEDRVDLRALQFVGDDQALAFPPNSILFHLVDGVYSLDLARPIQTPRPSTPILTSSYTALMRMTTLEHSLQDVMASQAAVAAQVNRLLEQEPPNAVPSVIEQAKLAQQYLTRQEQSLRAAQKRRDDLRASLDARRTAISEGRLAQDRAAADIAQLRTRLADMRELAAQNQDSIRGQRRRICADLADIFCINPDPAVSASTSLSFLICGLPLPNTTAEGDSLASDAASTTAAAPIGEDAISAALGLVALLVDELQYYLSVPLPYPVTALGSRSFVRDDISLLPDAGHQPTARAYEFPLYLPRGGSTPAHFRFDYGWFLLNKNIETLCVSQGLRVVDIRHTLPNLKYLLFVGSAGSDQMPARKAGGVRGLWARRLGRADATDGADDSSVGLVMQAPSCGADVRLRPASPALAALPPVELPFQESETKISLRTKGMRESAGR